MTFSSDATASQRQATEDPGARPLQNLTPKLVSSDSLTSHFESPVKCEMTAQATAANCKGYTGSSQATGHSPHAWCGCPHSVHTPHHGRIRPWSTRPHGHVHTPTRHLCRSEYSYFLIRDSPGPGSMISQDFAGSRRAPHSTVFSVFHSLSMWPGGLRGTNSATLLESGVSRLHGLWTMAHGPWSNGFSRRRPRRRDSRLETPESRVVWSPDSRGQRLDLIVGEVQDFKVALRLPNRFSTDFTGEWRICRD